MSALDETHSPNPEPPPWGLIVGVLLETSMLATFVYHRSLLGVVLYVAYFWFSATCSMLRRRS